jgi:hypothetical protein
MLLSGTLPSMPDESSAGFLLVGRQSGEERRYPVSAGAGPGGTAEVTGVVALAELPFTQDEPVDVYFVSGPDRVRVVFSKQPSHWLPYPTKFGNLSFKRPGT